MKIHITKGNSKLPKETLNFSLPPTISCPSRTKLCDEHCYAKKAYRQYSNVRTAWTENYKLSKTKKFVELMVSSIKTFKNWNQFRISVSGDMYNQTYLNKWFLIVKSFPDKIFYTYTKSYQLNYNNKPDNLIVIYSDDYLSKMFLPLRYFKQFDGVATVDNDLFAQERTQSYFKSFKTCQGDCKVCDYCYRKTKEQKKILFTKH